MGAACVSQIKQCPRSHRLSVGLGPGGGVGSCVGSSTGSRVGSEGGSSIPGPGGLGSKGRGGGSPVGWVGVGAAPRGFLTDMATSDVFGAK